MIRSFFTKTCRAGAIPCLNVHVSHSSSSAINDKNHGRQMVSAQFMSQCSTATTLRVSKQFRVLPIIICSLKTNFSLVLVTISKCQSWPCEMSTGIAGQSLCIAAGAVRPSSQSSSHRRSHASVQIPICGLPSVHDFIGPLVSMLMAMGRFCRRVTWFHDLTVFEAKGRRDR
jgi:hypothetical protein